MAEGFFRIKSGLFLSPQSSAPSSPSDGSIYYNSSDNKFKFRENGSWVEIGSAAGDIINGGQSGPITIGTNDTTDLNFEVNNVVKMRIDQSVDRIQIFTEDMDHSVSSSGQIVNYLLENTANAASSEARLQIQTRHDDSSPGVLWRRFNSATHDQNWFTGIEEGGTGWYLGQTTGGTSNAVNSSLTAIYVDDSNNITIPNGNLTISTSGSAIALEAGTTDNATTRTSSFAAARLKNESTTDNTWCRLLLSGSGSSSGPEIAAQLTDTSSSQGTLSFYTKNSGGQGIGIFIDEDRAVKIGESGSILAHEINGSLDVITLNALRIGANFGDDGNRSNDVTKLAAITIPHRLDAEEDFGALRIVSTATQNRIEVGGNDSSYNAATSIDFYTASNNTTTTGTLVGTVNNGAWVLGESGGTKTQTVNGDLSVIGAGTFQKDLATLLQLNIDNTNTTSSGTTKVRIGTSGAANAWIHYVTNDANAWSHGLLHSEDAWVLAENTNLTSNQYLKVASGGNLSIYNKVFFGDSSLSNNVEQEYVHSTSLSNNTTAVASEFTFDTRDIKGLVIDYTIKDGNETETGTLHVTVNNAASVAATEGSVSSTGTETSSGVGVSWSVNINGNNAELEYTTTNSGNNRTMRALVKKFLA